MSFLKILRSSSFAFQFASASRGNKASENRQKGFSTQVVIISIAAILFLGLFGALIYKTKQQKAEQQAKLGQTVKIEDSGWVKGASNAAVIITEFSDLQCPACKFHEPTLRAVLENNKETVALRYKHFPLMGHKYAVNAAVAAEAAGIQDKFWEMHDLLFEKQEEWSAANPPEPKFLEYARSLGLDTDKFQEDLKDSKIKEKINQQRNEGIKLGVSSTPTFFINGKFMATPNGPQDFQKLIDEELTKEGQ